MRNTADGAIAENAEDVRHHFGLAVNIARDGLRALLILNGGAAVALLALAGAVAGRSSLVNVADLSVGVVYFGFGAVATVFAHVTAYQSQLTYTNHLLSLRTAPDKADGQHRAHWKWNYATLAAVAVALTFAALGLYQSGQAVGIF
jgi:hypothetical protein